MKLLKYQKALILFLLCIGAFGFLRADNEDINQEKKPENEVVPEGAPVGAPEGAELKQLVKDLSAQDFLKRREAMSLLWAKGDEVLDLLTELSHDENPELSVRASELAEKISIGLLPDTPEEIAALLRKYRDADVDGKIDAFKALMRRQKYAYNLRIYRREKDSTLKRRLGSQMKDIIPELVRGKIREKDWDAALEYLQLGERNEDYIRLATFMQITGGYEEELQRLANQDDELSKRKYINFLRVKGDAAMLTRRALDLGQMQAYRTGSALIGNPVPMMENHLQERQNLNARLALEANLAKWKGDDELVAQKIEALMAAARDGGDNIRRQVVRALCNVGDFTKARELIQDDELFMETVLKFENLPRELLDLAGIEGRLPDQEWLAAETLKLKESLENGEEILKTPQIIRLAGYFDSWGEYEAAAQLIEAYVAAFEGEDRKNLLEREMHPIIHELPESFCRAVPLIFSEENQEEFTTLYRAYIDELTGANSYVQKVDEAILKANNEISAQDRLRLLISCCTSNLLVSEKTLDDFLAKLEAAAVENDDQVEFERLHLLAFQRNDSQCVLRMSKLLEGDKLDRRRSYLSLMYSYFGRWDEALVEIEKFVDQVGIERASPILLYRRGLLYEKTGQTVKAQADFEQANLLALNDRSYLLGVANLLNEFGKKEEAYQTYRLYTQCYDAFTIDSRRHLHHIALQNRDWKVAAALGECFLMRGDDFAYLYNLTSRYSADMCRGLALHAAGETQKGVQMIENAHATMIGNGSHADNLYPALREAGLHELHDRLFEEDYQRVKKLIAVFPNSANDKNSAAWLASRAMKNLDEAEKLVSESIAAEPKNAAYLDTMAEVWFARGNREKATEWSMKSLQTDVNDSGLREQNRRFISEDFPVK